MKNLIKIASAALLTAAMIAPTAQAEVSANVALATDYVFRGFSQTQEEPAISGGFDYAFKNGFYIGTWASNVDFGAGSEASTEIDLYAGYAFDVNDNLSLDFSVIQYVYPGEENSLNYTELVAASTIRGFDLGIVYSPDYFGSDSDAVVVNADYSFALTEKLSLDLHAGYTKTDEAGIAVEDDNYIDYSVALSTSAGGVDLALTFYGTDVDDVDLADDRVVFSIAKSF